MYQQHKEKTLGTANVRIAVIFFVCIIVLFLCSLLYKGIILWSKSSFHGDTQFNLAVFTLSKDARVYSFNPVAHTMVVVSVSGAQDVNALGKVVAIPFDSTVVVPTDAPYEAGSFLLYLASHMHVVQPTHMTIIDALRLFSFASRLPQGSVTKKTIHISPQTQQEDSDKIVSALFLDSTLYEEGKTVSIVNAAGRLGFGTVVSRILTNIGVHVVSVGTATEEMNSSRISYFGEKVYTIKRMQRIFGFPLIYATGNASIADVTIILGKDSLISLKSYL